MPSVSIKLSFIRSPKIIYIGEIPKIKWSLDGDLVFVVNFAIPMEFVHSPVSLICEFPIWIIKVSFTMHSIIFPLPFINTPLNIIEFPITVSHPIFSLSFISSSIILFNNILKIIISIFWTWIWILIRLLLYGRIVFSSRSPLWSLFWLSHVIYHLIWLFSDGIQENFIWAITHTCSMDVAFVYLLFWI